MLENSHRSGKHSAETRESDENNSSRSRATDRSRRETSRDRCPECGARSFVTDESEAVCPDCDVVINEAPVSRKRKRTFGHRDWKKNAQTAGRVTSQYVDNGIGSTAPWDLFSKDWQTERDSSATRLRYALREIRRIAGEFPELGDPECEAATALYRKAMDADCVVGRNIDAFTPACLLIAARRNQLPVSTAELAPVSRASESEINLMRTALEKELNLSVPILSPRTFLRRVCSSFGLRGDVERAIDQLLTRATEAGKLECHSYSPRVVIGAATHLACEVEDMDGPGLQELSEELDVAESSISQRKNIFRPHVEST